MVHKGTINRREQGQWAEEQACCYLQAQGLALLARNYRCAFGEIDLIMRDGALLVFVEVRQRRSPAFGGAKASVSWHKQQKIQKTAAHFLLQHRSMRSLACRFDVIALEGQHRPELQWLQNAFGQ
ncbi:MAG: YraN family protein [Legionellaceae bacterium]|nr:YraN family protein [Legionellaceae bacterium]